MAALPHAQGQFLVSLTSNQRKDSIDHPGCPSRISGRAPFQGFVTSAVSNQLRRDTKNTMNQPSETVRCLTEPFHPLLFIN